MEIVISTAVKKWLKIMRFGQRLGCHQRPERSFFYKGYQFPVCARCTGVIVGELVALIFLGFGIRLPILISALFVVPLAIDGGLQYIKVLYSTNLRRVITGLIAGFGLTYVYFYAIVFLVKFVVCDIGLFK